MAEGAYSEDPAVPSSVITQFRRLLSDGIIYGYTLLYNSWEYLAFLIVTKNAIYLSSKVHLLRRSSRQELSLGLSNLF